MEADFYRDAWVEINLDAIAENVKNMKALLSSDTDIMAVVKANGYGHGALETARTALESGATWLAVALMDEALALRAEGIEAPILVMGRIRPDDLHLAAEHHISVTVFQKEWVEEAILNYKGKHPVFLHLKFDTGMGRIGVREYNEALELIETLKRDPRFIVEGAYTHFATADEDNENYFEMQYTRFTEMINWLKSWQVNPPLIHCGNSAAGLKHPDRMHNLVRFGISMYGLLPAEEMEDDLPFPLAQAFSFHSRLVHCKQVSPNEGISYGATYFTKETEWIGTVPIGYADGWVRALAFKSDVLADGHRVPIVGRICMDQFMCRLPYKMSVGTKVTLIGGEGSEGITVQEVANRLNTISYEIPCMISSRVPRLYFRHRKKIGSYNRILDPFLK